MHVKLAYLLTIVLLCCTIELVNLCQSRTARTPTTDGPPRFPFFRYPYIYYPTLSPLPFVRYRRSPVSNECGRLSSSANFTLNNRPLISNESISWPWLATIYAYNNGNLFPRCRGSLISTRTILTSAFCFNGLDLHTKVYVSLGADKLITYVNDSSLHDVELIRIHSDYLKDASNDIALVVLTQSVRFSNSILPICLPNDSNTSLVYNKSVTIIGWSYTNKKHSFNKQQLSAVLFIKNGSPVCNNNTNDNKYCAFAVNSSNKQYQYGYEYGCLYASLGSPVMFYSNGIWYVYGITSSSYNPPFVCVPYGPSYYTIVPSYIDWINHNVS